MIIYECDFHLLSNWTMLILPATSALSDSPERKQEEEVFVIFTKDLQGVPKNALSEYCWSHSALAQSQVAGTLYVWKLIFWSFLTKTKPDQAFASHVHGKI